MAYIVLRNNSIWRYDCIVCSRKLVAKSLNETTCCYYKQLTSVHTIDSILQSFLWIRNCKIQSFKKVIFFVTMLIILIDIFIIRYSTINNFFSFSIHFPILSLKIPSWTHLVRKLALLNESWLINITFSLDVLQLVS